MNYGMLDQILLEKNIEKLVLYTDEEYSVLQNIVMELECLQQEYHTKNVNELSTSTLKLKEDVNKIKSKRVEYINALQKVIEQYNRLSNEVTSIFEEKMQNE